MEFNKLVCVCACGRPSARIREVGLTSEHELAIGWWCMGCKREVFLVKPLSDCWRECPTSSNEDEIGEIGGVSAYDAQFIRSMGIQFPEEVDS